MALSFLPSAGAAWYWAGLVGAGRPYLLVRDLELDLPRRPAAREVRGPGLWADINCETPHEHWSLGLEAFGVALDDPEEALGAERGHRTGLGLDLEWEATGAVLARAPGPPTLGGGDYEQFCEVHGEVLVGGGYDVETIAIAAHGWRRHAWGAVDWSATPWSLRGRLAGGGPFASDAATGDLPVMHRAPLRLREGHLERAMVAFGDDARGDAGWGWSQVGRLEVR